MFLRLSKVLFYKPAINLNHVSLKKMCELTIGTKDEYTPPEQNASKIVPTY